MKASSEDIDRLRRVTGGDAGALEELYDRYVPLLFPVALRILGSRADAEDTMQEVWVQVWNRAGSFDPDRGAVPAWLLTITRSRALDRYRSRTTRRRREDEAEPESTPGTDSARAAEENETRAEVERALASLSPQHREVIELAYWEGLSQSQIAERVGSPLGTVKSWTRQALRDLRHGFGEVEW